MAQVAERVGVGIKNFVIAAFEAKRPPEPAAL
jgi:hypothetical protein